MIGNKRAGVAIAIEKSIPPFVKGIYRIDGRAMEIRLKTGNPIKSTHTKLLCAPHIGYHTETLGKYWEYMDAYISPIPNNLIKIWRTDNNGQLSRGDINSQYIGKWALWGILESIYSQNVSRNCEHNVWDAGNTFFIQGETAKLILLHGIVVAEI